MGRQDSPLLARCASISISALICLLAYTAIVAFGSHRGFPESLVSPSRWPFLSDKPVGEDGYYLMLVAWNLGAGDGLTANFGQTATGVQPLMTLVLAAFARGLQLLGMDKFTLARVVILFGGVLLGLFAYLAARISRRLVSNHDSIAPLVTFIAAATSFYLWRLFTYGLETGLYLVLLVLTVETTLAACDSKAFTLRRNLAIGCLIGLCGLARIDFGLVAALVLVGLLATRQVTFTSAIVIGGTGFLVTLPWFVWVKHVSGHWMPTSGPAQARLVDAASAWGRAEAMLNAVAQNLVPWWPVDGQAVLPLIAIILFAIGVALARPAHLRPLAVWLPALAALPVVYYLFFWAAHFYPRYTAPLALIGVLVIGASAARVPPRARRPLIVSLFAVLLILNGAAAFRDLHMGRIGDGHAVTAGFVARHVPATIKVGAFQSGVTGYYNANVVNLDGKLNQDALEALRSGDIEGYLDRSGIDVVVDWEGVISGFMPAALESGRWKRCGIPVGNLETICVQRSGMRNLALR